MLPQKAADLVDRMSAGLNVAQCANLCEVKILTFAGRNRPEVPLGSALK